MARNVGLAELVSLAQESRLSDVWTAMPGVVQSYDPTTRTADIRACVRRPIENVDTGEIEHEDLPILPSVPVLFPGAKGGIMMSWPIAQNTTGLLLVLTLSAAKWRSGADDGKFPAEPGDLRMHHPANVVFLPGWIPDTASTPATAEPALVVAASEVRLGDHTATDFVALAPATDARLDALEDFAANHTHGGVTTGSGSTGTAPGAPSGASVAATQVKAK